MNIKRDDYFVIFVTMPSGFECKIPARGYNLKSWCAFEDKLNATYYYEQTTKEVYEHLVFGDPNGIVDTEDDDGRGSKSKTQQETPTKRKPRAKASEDSKAVRSTKQRTTSTSKTSRNELRKPKLSNVRKPKKDVARTNNSGTKSPSRNGNRKVKTQ